MFRILIAGYYSSVAYESKILNSCIAWNPYLKSTTTIFSNVTSDYSFNTISTISTILLNSNSVAYTNETLISTSAINFTDIKGQSDISMNLVGYSNSNLKINTTTYIPIDPPWVVSGTSTVSYALSTWYGSSVPSFVSLDLANYQLIVDTTGVTPGSSYSFGISSTIANLKLINYLKKNNGGSLFWILSFLFLLS